MEVEREIPKLYTHEEVLTIVSNLKATIPDYLILTYFKIYKIASGPLFKKYEVRFNNIIVNNFTKICMQLTKQVFIMRALRLFNEEIPNITYLSCILPNINCRPVVLVQYFDPEFGLQTRCLFLSHSMLHQNTEHLAAILCRFHLQSKLVGFCGHYSYKEAGDSSSSEFVTTFRDLSGNRVVDLPYCDDFIKNLFDLIFDFFTNDVLKAVVKLGEVVIGLNEGPTAKSQLFKDLMKKYKKFQKSSAHILESEYCEFVISNYDSIRDYLRLSSITTNLPKCVRILFDSVLNRFLLIFAHELFAEIAEIKFTDNSAVVYYFNLVKINKKFDIFGRKFRSVKAYAFLNNHLDYLISTRTCSPEDRENIDLKKQAKNIISETYSRAQRYIEPLLRQFENFDNYSWVLLKPTHPLKFEKLHATFHLLKNAACDNCDALREEVRILNAALFKVPLLEVESVVLRWLLVLKEAHMKVPIVLDLLKYLLSLPASCNLAVDTGDLQKDQGDLVRLNMVRCRAEDVLQNIEEFFSLEMEIAKEVVKMGRIESFED